MEGNQTLIQTFESSFLHEILLGTFLELTHQYFFVFKSNYCILALEYQIFNENDQDLTSHVHLNHRGKL